MSYLNHNRLVIDRELRLCYHPLCFLVTLGTSFVLEVSLLHNYSYRVSPPLLP